MFTDIGYLLQTIGFCLPVIPDVGSPEFWTTTTHVKGNVPAFYFHIHSMNADRKVTQDEKVCVLF